MKIIIIICFNTLHQTILKHKCHRSIYIIDPYEMVRKHCEVQCFSRHIIEYCHGNSYSWPHVEFTYMLLKGCLYASKAVLAV